MLRLVLVARKFAPQAPRTASTSTLLGKANHNFGVERTWRSLSTTSSIPPPKAPSKDEPMQTFEIKPRPKISTLPTKSSNAKSRPASKIPGGSAGQKGKKEDADDDDKLDVKFRVNGDIKGLEEAMCVAPSGALGKLPFAKIQEEAVKLKLDMVEVARAPHAVIKLMDFAAFVEEKKKLRKQREILMGTQPKNLEEELPPLKEVQIGTNIDHHDFELKKAVVRKFLEKKHPVKLVLKFKKGASGSKADMRPEKANQLVERLLSDLSDIVDGAKVKNDPKPVMGTLVKFMYAKDLTKPGNASKSNSSAAALPSNPIVPAAPVPKVETASLAVAPPSTVVPPSSMSPSNGSTNPRSRPSTQQKSPTNR